MDREIPKEIRRKRLIGTITKAGLIVAGIALVVFILVSLFHTKVSRNDIRTSVVDRGAVELSVTASGTVVPAFEEIINSPIQSRIVEVYKKGGDSVDTGTPILKLDLQSAETEYGKLQDENRMKQLQLEQLRITNRSRLSEMEMKLKVLRMELGRKEAELKNEIYLDSLGAGTTDKVRQVELSVNVSRLQLREEEQKYENEKALANADLKVKELELDIFRKSMAETKRTLDDAQIRSPRKGILTYINNEIGAQVQQGSRLAILSDLSHFKVDGEIADAYGDRIAPGYKVMVKIGADYLPGIVSDVTPLSRNGTLSFTARLDEDGHSRLRSGLNADVYIMNTIKPDVIRIRNASYYSGPGDYYLFILKGNELQKRKVKLGESNYDYVEVIEGLNEGDEVVVSDMSNYKDKNKVGLK